MKRILVTGGAGFIGSHLVDRLLAEGHTVRILDGLVPQVHGPDPRWPAWVPQGIDRIHGDVRDPAVWTRALDGMEVVYHLAAEVGVGQSMYEIVRYMDANTMGTAQLLELLAHGRHRVEKLIVASSMSIYGEGAYRAPDGRVVHPRLRTEAEMAAGRWDSFAPEVEGDLVPLPTAEDKPLLPTSIYAICKRDQEEMALSVGVAYRIPTVALRFFNTYGRRQALSNPYTGVVAIFSGRYLNGKAPIVFEDGRQARDFVHVSDIVQGLVLAMQRPQADYQAINLGTGRATSVLDVGAAIGRTLGLDIAPEVNHKFRAGDIRTCYADITRARALLGYEPKVSLDAGIADLIEWLQGQTAVDRVETATAELAARGLTR